MKGLVSTFDIRPHFAIADLTYARPSVYFEAGYAQRQVPVIYIARKDHFTPRLADEFGNYKVHFDLQMKNIIPWSNASDNVFVKKLKARINKVISPLLKEKNAKKQNTYDESKFAFLATNEKLKLVSHDCWSEIAATGFIEIVADNPPQKRGYSMNSFPIYLNSEIIEPYYFERSQYKFTSLMKPTKIGIKRKGAAIASTIFYVTDSIRKKQLDNLFAMLNMPPIYNVNPSSNFRNISRIDEYIFIASLNYVPKARVMESMTSYQYDEIKKRYTWKTSTSVPAKHISNFNEIYVFPPNSHIGLLARNAGEKFIRFYVNGNKITQFYLDNKPVGLMNNVNRYINIFLLTPIKSEHNLLEQITQILKLNKI
jgi:hypothetical protein